MARTCSVLVVTAVIFGVLSGCDASVDAFDPDDAVGPYSVFGYLDATADTQFVRIEPLRDSLLIGTSGGPLETRVTSTNVVTGETVVWRDSLFRLGADVPVGNFYTTSPLSPDATYRFRAEPPGGGATTTAEVTVPPDFPRPTFADTSGASPGIAVLRVKGVEQLGAAVARYRAVVCRPVLPGSSQAPDCGTRQAATSHLQDTTRVAGGAYRVRINWRAGLQDLTLGDEFVSEILSARATVASVSDDWPDFAGRSVAEQRQAPQPPPDVGTNIEQGTGYLGGAVTKTVPIPTELEDLADD